MSESAQSAASTDDPHAGQPISEAVREAVESGNDVSDRVRDIVVNMFRGTDGTAASARAAVQGIVQTASNIVNRSTPEQADSVLRNVIDGVTGGLKSVAQTTQYAVQEAASRGQRFASEDLDRAKKDLNGISDILVDTVRYFANRMTQETGSAMRDLKTHAERAVSSAAPIVNASIDAVMKHPRQAAGEAASAAIRGGQLTAGALLSAVSGALAGAAELLDPDRRKSEAAASKPANQKDQTS